MIFKSEAVYIQQFAQYVFILALDYIVASGSTELVIDLSKNIVY